MNAIQWQPTSILMHPRQAAQTSAVGVAAAAICRTQPTQCISCV